MKPYYPIKFRQFFSWSTTKFKPDIKEGAYVPAQREYIYRCLHLKIAAGDNKT